MCPEKDSEACEGPGAQGSEEATIVHPGEEEAGARPCFSLPEGRLE